MRNALAAALVVALAGACRRPTPPPGAGVVGTRPQTEAACAACQGQWGVHGLADVPSCLCRTKDAGKRCRDGNECEGVCIAQTIERDIVVAGPPPRGFFVGRCSPHDVVFGCWRIIPRGAAKGGPQVLGDAPDEVCID